MRIMITGGGTGGHTSPAVAVIEELRRRDPQLLLQWVGKRGGIEERVSKSVQVPFRAVPVEGWPRERSPRRLWAGAKLVLGGLRALGHLYVFRPQVVFGVGGYVSLPLLWVAQRRGVPTMIHEQNKRLGMANRMLAPRATRVFLSYEDTIGSYPQEHARVVGNPVRAGFLDPPSMEEARQTLGLKQDVPVVLISGGSQGARAINRAVADALPAFRSGEVQFLWMTGKHDTEMARKAAERCAIADDVITYSFINDMVTACAAADLIVGRAGASSTAEIAVLGKPSMLIPFPFATDNHQEQNARAFEDAGAAVVLAESQFTPDSFVAQVRLLLEDDELLDDMGHAARGLAKPMAAEAIVEEMMTLIFGK